MQHLDTDRLPALADERPTAAEAEHLAVCLPCRRERDAYVALLALARREGDASMAADRAGGVPLTSWDALAPALRADGLLRDPARGEPAVTAATSAAIGRTGRWAGAAGLWRRAAAAIALVAGGAALGRASAPRSAGDLPAQGAVAERVVAPAAPAVPADQAANASGAATASLGISDTIPVSGEPRSVAQLAANGGGDFAGMADALAALARAQHDYQRAASYLTQHDSTATAGTPQILRARLAALNEVMPKVREAMYEAPQDPVLSQYYMTTYDVRETTLRQLGRVQPVGTRINAY